MKKKTLNGTPIPYCLSVEELKKMISSPIMKDFSLACEALSYKNDSQAYQIMKAYINDKDKYRRLYILKTIFRHPEAMNELVEYLENAIASDDFLLVENGLLVISDFKIKVCEDLLFSVVGKHLPSLYCGLSSLRTLDVSDENYAKLKELFRKAKKCAQKEIIAEILAEKYLPSKSEELFGLFGCDGYAKIRLMAVELASDYGYNLSEFLSDIDGHVKKLAAKSLGALSFLSEYVPRYRVDVSEDLESAIIYNQQNENHIYVEYDEADEASPYMLSFSFQHVHVTDRESAKEWIDGVLSENILAIEFFCGKDRQFGGQINACDLSNLSYEFLEQHTGYFGLIKLFQAVDSFKVRGWSKTKDLDGCFVQKNGKIQIKFLSDDQINR